MRILVANRGEIARRIIRTARNLGHETVAVYADPDVSAPFVSEATTAVRIGPAALAESYLSIEALLAAAKGTDADAVHPGYGFLAENAEFAQAVTEQSMVWIGPNSRAISAMGSKIEARRLAEAAGVPIIPGYDASQDVDDLAQAAASIGFPVLVKAAAGGGGKGIRIVRSAPGFAAALEEASTEALRSFGDGSMIVERFIEQPRHVEVQIVGDKHGTVLHFGTRECSVQRRYQKLLEEAPAPNLPDATRSGLHGAAVSLASSIGYDSAGTIEFIVDAATEEFFFLEMNTRLQVEHPVTEFVTGVDLVELQIRVACDQPLPMAQDDITFTGHAFEARINAEDANRDFAPQIGTVHHLHVPSTVRWDSAVVLGSEVTPFYDPMIAKIIVGAEDRDTARMRLGAALDELIIGGIVTNTGFHRWLIDQPPIVTGRVTTRFLDDNTSIASPDTETAVALAARAWVTQIDSEGHGVWDQLPQFALTPHHSPRIVFLRDLAGVVHEIETSGTSDARRHAAASVDTAHRSVAVNLAGATHFFTVVSRSDHWAPAIEVGHGSASSISAPFPGVVTEVTVTPGDNVAAHHVVVVIEAMKMLHSLSTTGPGVVAEVRVTPGDNVASNQVLITFVSDDVPDTSQPQKEHT